MTDLTRLEALLARVPEGTGLCPFCGRDPYEYVDNGVGFERVAVSCCDLGIGLLQHGDEQLQTEVVLRTDLATALRSATEALREAREALRPFAEFPAAKDDRLPPEMAMTRGSHFAARQVTVADFRRARTALATIIGE